MFINNNLNVVIDEYLVPCPNVFKQIVSGFSRLYDDGYQACYYCAQKLKVFTYCEGDVKEIKCIDDLSLNDELQENLTFFNANQ